jgi:IS4 transposase
MFYLLLYALLTDDKLSQRGIADLYSSPNFRLLFNFQLKTDKLAHSSVSDRLAMIEVDYFKQLYEYMYDRYSRLFPAKTLSGLKLQRVDSSLVAEMSNKLKEGLTCGNEHTQRKMLKFTINYDGMYGSCAKVHKEEKYASEALALPENVIAHFKSSADHAQVYIFDRGQSSANAFSTMKSHKGLLFVGRLLENRKLHIVKECDCTFKRFEQGTVKQDALVWLYKTETVEGKSGKPVHRQTLVKETFRVIRFRPKDGKEDILLITNILNLRAETIALMYRRRWDIEVFFRFLKQDVNFSRFISLNDNGIQVILYMTLIVAMLIMVYSKENELGFKTAKRRMEIELQELIIAIAVVLSGGKLEKLDLPAP